VKNQSGQKSKESEERCSREKGEGWGRWIQGGRARTFKGQMQSKGGLFFVLERGRGDPLDASVPSIETAGFAGEKKGECQRLGCVGAILGAGGVRLVAVKRAKQNQVQKQKKNILNRLKKEKKQRKLRRWEWASFTKKLGKKSKQITRKRVRSSGGGKKKVARRAHGSSLERGIGQNKENQSSLWESGGDKGVRLSLLSKKTDV